MVLFNLYTFILNISVFIKTTLLNTIWDPFMLSIYFFGKTIPDLCWELAQLQDTYILQGISGSFYLQKCIILSVNFLYDNWCNLP